LWEYGSTGWIEDCEVWDGLSRTEGWLLHGSEKVKQGKEEKRREVGVVDC
jgi:hypothetical protein